LIKYFYIYGGKHNVWNMGRYVNGGYENEGMKSFLGYQIIISILQSNKKSSDLLKTNC